MCVILHNKIVQMACKVFFTEQRDKNIVYNLFDEVQTQQAVSNLERE